MRFFALFAAIALFLASPVQAREVVDMAGRHVTIPDKIGKVYSSSHPVSLLLYALAPELLVGINFRVRDEIKPYLPREVLDLPVIGAAMGHGPQMNPEEVLALHPDFILVWLDRFSDNDFIRAQYEKAGLPVLFVKLDTLADHPAALTFLGDVLQRPQRARQLSDYIVAALDRVRAATANLPPEKRRRVYYAEGKEGLSTECDDSWHAELIPLAGAENVHHCRQATHGGGETVSLEQVIAYKPDFVLAQDRQFVANALAQPVWRNVPAIPSRAIAFAPRLPFNWVDRPPSFMRAIGVQWLANLLYPDLLPLDLRGEMKRFYKLFLNVDLSDADVDEVMR
ncbi:iron complex transport system substrate-binding protein [Rhodoblastus acidophilus]|uniref:Iron complex transport system substrate-binding protein n=1 Tax=Rhodoblastus acidophilus TaxID=1074 RepID=A0A212SD35_RHOAC|nr:ABC transporter substrate-binding protein [Rhodoblastus acidophilus]PPQ35259.1 ABC transporter substrate-binding protein [Rhodoblastus acidophilus]RAI16359.1 ABC transporter substrate-binding protein [Rhodoblastus acidophilus]SNB83483.1 iron complex transport system substrate-binding protein [Rhodoblastus acidophilus]